MSRLLSSLPVGSLVKEDTFTYLGTTPIFRVLEHGHSDDPVGSSTLEFRDIICCKPYDATEPDNPVSDRDWGGNNNYKYSNLLQWLNSEASSGSWYTSKHAYDTPPTTENVQNKYGGKNPYDQEAGFLSFFPSKLKSALLNVSKTTDIPSYDQVGGITKESVTSKLFLLDKYETYDGNVWQGDPRHKYTYYVDKGSSRNIPKDFASSAAKGNCTQLGSSSWWWSRNPGGSASNVPGIGWTGAGTNNMAAFQSDGGVSPAFCVSSDQTVTDNPDSNGVYSFIWNDPPTISPATTNYGNRTTPPAITTTITDPDGDSFTYTIKLNGVTKASGSATGTKTIALDMTSYWGQMALGSNTIVVSATDSNGATASATYTMNKTNSAPPVPTTDLTNNSRKETSFYVGFQIGQDADGDSQTVVVQVSASSDMSSPTEFSGVEKLVAGAWIPVQTLTNADAGASLRIQVTGQTVGNTIYVRLKDSDSGSGSSVYTSVYTIKIGSVLEFDTLPITRTTKPTMVVAYLDKTKPSDATVQMFACNNANDGTPTWEPITEGVTHEFTNKTKTAANWGVSVKTSIAAGATAGEISVSAIGVGVL